MAKFGTSLLISAAACAVLSLGSAGSARADTVYATYTGTVISNIASVYTPANGPSTVGSSQFVGDAVQVTFTRNTDVGLFSLPDTVYAVSDGTYPPAETAQILLDGSTYNVAGLFYAEAAQTQNYVGGSFPFTNAPTGANGVWDKVFDGLWNNSDIFAPLPYSSYPVPDGFVGTFTYINVSALIQNVNGNPFATPNLNTPYSYQPTATDDTDGFIDYYSIYFDGGIASYFERDIEFSISQVTVSPNPVVSSVPEPATWAMMLIGLVGVGVASRRRGFTSSP